MHLLVKKCYHVWTHSYMSASLNVLNILTNCQLFVTDDLMTATTMCTFHAAYLVWHLLTDVRMLFYVWWWTARLRQPGHRKPERCASFQGQIRTIALELLWWRHAPLRSNATSYFTAKRADFILDLIFQLKIRLFLEC